jgi:hypothetical protein
VRILCGLDKKTERQSKHNNLNLNKKNLKEGGQKRKWEDKRFRKRSVRSRRY